MLFKHPSKWTATQKERADILFPAIRSCTRRHKLGVEVGRFFIRCKSKKQAFKKLALWCNYVEEASIDSFKTVYQSVQAHYLSILNFFHNTKAAAESINAKVKAFRATSRGVRDTSFFLFRLANIYA